MKKPFKKLIKHSKKFRKQHGLSKNDFTHKITVNPKDQKEVIGLLRMAHDLDDAVEVIYEIEKGIPEILDKQSLEITGLRLRDFTSFYCEFATRMMMSKGVESMEEKCMVMTGKLTSLACLNRDGSIPNMHHITDEDFNDYIRCYDAFMMSSKGKTRDGVIKTAKFVACVCKYAETLEGGESNDN